MMNVPDLTGNTQADVQNLYDALVAMKRDYDWQFQNIDETNMTDTASKVITDSVDVDTLNVTDTSIIGILAGATVIDITITNDSNGNISAFTDNITGETIAVTMGRYGEN